ncbi:MAG: CheB methylesterase [Ramlibacter sp.]|jgi:two-component system chemotaxis response regulator CheB|uniref:chemotaxis protein CheB n=1 Tax=Ramlibacter sp. TaxID=1917967 RepID=UPI00262BE4FA|nr:chemotaxis protein CheB [Ramlibacter sp.]MDB5750608.1 CheB methylesterase [Ramlibacter sp.]
MVQHMAVRAASLLPGLLAYQRATRRCTACDGDRLVPGTLFIAPPDRDLVVDGERPRLILAPREHHSRPATDPLFRTAAPAWGPRVVGIIPERAAGRRQRRPAGDQAAWRHRDRAGRGRTAMPANAMAAAHADHCVPWQAIGLLWSGWFTARSRPTERRIMARIERTE